MKPKTILFVVVAAIFFVVAGFLLLAPGSHRKAPARVLTTTIKVIEGVVDVYRVENGKRDYRGPFKAGEEAVVQTQIAGGKDTKALGALASLVPAMAAVIQKQADAAAARMVDGQYAGHLSGEEISRSLNEHLGDTGLSEPRCVITAEGLIVTAVMGRGFLKAPIALEGRFTPTEGGGLDLALSSLKIGPVQLPDWALRQLEDVFRAAMDRSPLAVEVLEIEYEDDGILVYARRRQ